MINDNVKITHEDIITVNDKILSESEIVELIEEYMTENCNLHKEILDYKVREEQSQLRIEYLEKENAQLTIELEALKQIKPLQKLPTKWTVLKID